MNNYVNDAIIEEVIKREKELLRIKELVKAREKRTVEGRLRIVENKKNGFVQYYNVKEGQNRTGVYLGKNQINIAKELAQRGYDEEILKEIEDELKVLRDVKRKYHPETIPQIITKMNRNRQTLITNKILSNKEYAENWQAISYEGKGFDIRDKSEHYTDKDERVRSKSEILIANALKRNNIPYKYEYPTYIEGYSIPFYPDFTCLNVRTRKEIVWEHLGRMGEEEYARKNVSKIDAYLMNGYKYGDNYILTMETAEKQISTKTIEMIINRYLK